ncbi:hypothetical protein RND71_001839 [Anisodus tanguticus]|uniref:Uncharacterized protein n=1 Tax=Anisodus tanguticus TaxID=243964 RepID=A0AAE1T1L7_9SOLA|nr:hypothetical protein RND71_001839 [Anisodus tanguticus]
MMESIEDHFDAINEYVNIIDAQCRDLLERHQQLSDRLDAVVRRLERMIRHIDTDQYATPPHFPPILL